MCLKASLAFLFFLVAWNLRAGPIRILFLGHESEHHNSNEYYPLLGKAGQGTGLSFDNTDHMPHNLVIIVLGTYQSVGKATDLMLSDPSPASKNYVPDHAKVIAQTPMVLPKSKFELVFQAPEQPGRYPFLCTFPGHWRLMKGELIILP